MIIFFDDRPFRIIKTKQLSVAETSKFDEIYDLRLEKPQKDSLTGHVLFLNGTGAAAIQIISLMEKSFPQSLLSITFATREKEEVEEKIKSLYKVIKASGGVVAKDGKWLFMYRRKIWDLPKGKLDKGEDSQKAAIREIEEETGVKVTIEDKICTTWHTYTFNNNRILKRTKWYMCTCVDDSRMQPQAEEQIEKLEWYSLSECNKILINSFSSIRYVVDNLKKMKGIKEVK
jgi:ADP-ribose pyrophosphatase YjhB (NUDIX family)